MVRPIDALFAIERDISGQGPQKRWAVRQDLSRPLVEFLHASLALKRLEFSKTHDLYVEFPGFGYLTHDANRFRYEPEPWSPIM